MALSSGELPSSRLVYDGAALSIEFFVISNGVVPAEEWLEQLPLAIQ